MRNFSYLLALLITFLLFGDSVVAKTNVLPSFSQLLKKISRPFKNGASINAFVKRVEHLKRVEKEYKPLLIVSPQKIRKKARFLFSQACLQLAKAIEETPPRAYPGEGYHERFYLTKENLTLSLLDKAQNYREKIRKINSE